MLLLPSPSDKLGLEMGVSWVFWTDPLLSHLLVELPIHRRPDLEQTVRSSTIARQRGIETALLLYVAKERSSSDRTPAVFLESPVDYVLAERANFLNGLRNVLSCCGRLWLLVTGPVSALVRQRSWV